MRNQITKIIDILNASYWFLPAALALAGIVLSLIMVQLDLRFGDSLTLAVKPLIQATPQGIRAVLTTVAGSMITVAGTVFSLTMVVLTLASQQYGPLVVSNFMRDRTNQFALGAFIATFIYCLIALPTINDSDVTFVPVLSGIVAIALALFNSGLLIYFIHHTSQSVQPSHIINVIGQALIESMDRLFPSNIGNPPDISSEAESRLLSFYEKEASYSVRSAQSGYIQFIDATKVMDLTKDHDLVLNLVLRPGAFTTKGAVLAQLYPVQRVTEAIVAKVQSAIAMGEQRTLVQDSDLLVTQLGQIALRALSPGINDPYTAMLCIDRLGQALAKIAAQGTPAPCRYDDQGKLRIIANPLDFHELLHISFDGIRNYGAKDWLVMDYLLRALGLIAQTECSESARNAVRDYAGTLWQVAQTNITDPDNLQHVELQMHSFQHALNQTNTLYHG